MGYHCHTTPAIVGTLERGTEAFVLTTLVVREDAQTLYAFTDSDQRQTFLALQKVSGVGARVALAIMSVLTPAELAAAVAEGMPRPCNELLVWANASPNAWSLISRASSVLCLLRYRRLALRPRLSAGLE